MIKATKRIICLWAGPGVGKSTTAAGLFALLKKNGFNCEMNREYIKDWIWEGRKVKPGDQTYIFAKQARKERQYIENGLDYIISDSPMALCMMYGKMYDKYEQEFNACGQMLKQHHQFCKDHGYKVEHIYLERYCPYNPAGRFQTEDEAKVIDEVCLAFLEEMKFNFVTFACRDGIEKELSKYLINLQLDLEKE